jgi:hypothetical protein
METVLISRAVLAGTSTDKKIKKAVAKLMEQFAKDIKQRA